MKGEVINWPSCVPARLNDVVVPVREAVLLNYRGLRLYMV